MIAIALADIYSFASDLRNHIPLKDFLNKLYALSNKVANLVKNNDIINNS
jgi:hypothetical protein